MNKQKTFFYLKKGRGNERKHFITRFEAIVHYLIGIYAVYKEEDDEEYWVYKFKQLFRRES